MADKIRVTVWNEFRHEKTDDDVKKIYPNGLHATIKEFLDKNEGLRSRIAFHLDFPDYNADELVEILALMAEQNPALAQLKERLDLQID